MCEKDIAEAFYKDVVQLAARIHQVVHDGKPVLQILRSKTFPMAKVSRTWTGKVKVILYPDVKELT